MTHFGILEFNNLAFQKKRLLEFAVKTQDPTKMLKRALLIANRAHQNQFRDEGVEYLIHPIRTANILCYEKNIDDAELLSAMLLHDVIEDSPVSFTDIQNQFTNKVARLVKNLTRERPTNETEEEKSQNKTKKFLEIMASDQETRLAKCADLLDNIRCWPLIPLTSPSAKKFPRWLKETEQFAIPLAEKTDAYLAEKMKQTYYQVQKFCQTYKI